MEGISQGYTSYRDWELRFTGQKWLCRLAGAGAEGCRSVGRVVAYRHMKVCV